MNNFTIILFLKDRHEFNERFFEYYQKYGSKYNLIISDGGKKKIDKKILKKINSSKKIKYIKYVEDLDYKRYYKKIYSTLKIVKTKLVLFAANDDFIIYKNIPKLLNFLSNNDSYVGAGGRVIGFKLKRISGKKCLTEIQTIYKKKVNLENINHQKRVLYLLNNYSNIPLMSIMKTKVLINSYRYSSAIFNNNIELKDHFTALFNLSQGRIKMYREPIIFHEDQINSEGNKRSRVLIKSLSDKNYIDDVFLLDKILSKKLNLKRFKIFKIYLEQFFKTYLNATELKTEPSMNKIIDLVLKKTKRRLKFNKLINNKNINSDILKIKKELEFFLNKNLNEK